MNENEEKTQGQNELERFKYVSYLAFVLGYDILHDDIAESDRDECDHAYDECVKLAERFHGSEWDDEERPVYECLQDFAEHIKSEGWKC